MARAPSPAGIALARARDRRKLVARHDLGHRGNDLARERAAAGADPVGGSGPEQRVADAGHRPGAELAIVAPIAAAGEFLAHPIVDEGDAMDVGHRARQQYLPRLGAQPAVVDATDGTIAFLEGAGQCERAAQGFSVHRGAIDDPDLTGDARLVAWRG